MKNCTVIFLICLFSLFIIPNAEGVNIERRIQFSVDEIKGADYAFPAFKAALITPDGDVFGWDNNSKQWTGSIISSEVDSGTFDFPDPSQECTSTEPSIERERIISPETEGRYTTLSAIYCKSRTTGENSFTGSAYSTMMGGPDGTYTVVIYPEKYAILDSCYGYNIYDDDSYNDLCMDLKYRKLLVVAPGVEQRLELDYNYKDKSANRVEKVVTSASLTGSWESCRSMGMIKNYGLYTSVQKKLENAARQQEKGQAEAAAKMRAAALSEIGAQMGKGIDPICGAIMMEDLTATPR